MKNLNYRGNLVLFLALANDLITSWEAGRQAAISQGSFSDNPYLPSTYDHEEWSRGFANGLRDKAVSVAATNVDASVVTPASMIQVQRFPERSFWAEANRLQLRHSLSNEQLAARLGVRLDQLNEAMILHRFYDADAIPVGIREAG